MLRTYGRIRQLKENDPVLQPTYSNIKGIEGIYYVDDAKIIKDYFDVKSNETISGAGFLKVSLYANKDTNELKDIYSHLTDVNLMRDAEVFVKYHYYTESGNIYEWKYIVDKKIPTPLELGLKKKVITNNNISDLYYSEDELNTLFYKRSYFSPLYYYTSIGNNPNKNVDDIGNDNVFYIENNGKLNVRPTVSMSLTDDFNKFNKKKIGNIDAISVVRYPNNIGDFNPDLLPLDRGTIKGQISYPQYRNNRDPGGDLVRFVNPVYNKDFPILRKMNVPTIFSGLSEFLGDKLIKTLDDYLSFESYDLRGNYYYIQNRNNREIKSTLNKLGHDKGLYFLSRAIRTPDEDLVYIPQIHYGPSVPIRALGDYDGSSGIKINYIIRDLLERNLNNVRSNSNLITNAYNERIPRYTNIEGTKQYAAYANLGLFGQYYKIAHSTQIIDNPVVDKLKAYIKENHIVEDIRLGNPVTFTKDISDNTLATPAERERAIYTIDNEPNMVLTNIKFEINQDSFRYRNIDQEGLKPYSLDRNTFLTRMKSRVSYGFNHNLTIDKLTATFRPLEIKIDGEWTKIKE